MIKKHGFTLIEMVIVILIVGILAAIAVPKIINLAVKAKDSSDDAVIGALKSAINIHTSKNIVTGTKNAAGNYYPSENPFTLLEKSPPYKTDVNFDGRSWIACDAYVGPGWQFWWIYCPHCEGSASALTKGRRYTYRFGGISAGQFSLEEDYGH